MSSAAGCPWSRTSIRPPIGGDVPEMDDMLTMQSVDERSKSICPDLAHGKEQRLHPRGSDGEQRVEAHPMACLVSSALSGALLWEIRLFSGGDAPRTLRFANRMDGVSRDAHAGAGGVFRSYRSRASWQRGSRVEGRGDSWAMGVGPSRTGEAPAVGRVGHIHAHAYAQGGGAKETDAARRHEVPGAVYFFRPEAYHYRVTTDQPPRDIHVEAIVYPSTNQPTLLYLTGGKIEYEYLEYTFRVSGASIPKDFSNP